MKADAFYSQYIDENYVDELTINTVTVWLYEKIKKALKKRYNITMDSNIESHSYIISEYIEANEKILNIMNKIRDTYIPDIYKTPDYEFSICLANNTLILYKVDKECNYDSYHNNDIRGLKNSMKTVQRLLFETDFKIDDLCFLLSTDNYEFNDIVKLYEEAEETVCEFLLAFYNLTYIIEPRRPLSRYNWTIDFYNGTADAVLI